MPPSCLWVLPESGAGGSGGAAKVQRDFGEREATAWGLRFLCSCVALPLVLPLLPLGLAAGIEFPGSKRLGSVRSVFPG